VPIPSQVEIRRPMLEVLVGGDELELSRIVQILSEKFGLSREEIELTDPPSVPGSNSIFYDRLCWARWDLAQAELVSIPRQGFTRIMQRGVAALQHGPDVLTDEYLERYVEYSEYLVRMRTGHEPGPYDGDIRADGTPLPPIVDPHVWVEKTIVEGRTDRNEGENRLGKALWSPKRSKGNTDIYHFMRDVAIGDIVLHLTDNRAITGISEAVSVAEEFSGLEGTEWGRGDSYRVRLASFTPLDPPLARDVFFASPFRERLQAIIESGQKNLFYNAAPALNQGAYLTPAPPALLRVLNDAYKSVAGRPLVMRTTGHSADSQADVAEDAVLFDRLVGATHWSEAALSEVVAALRHPDHPARQIIFAGPPGTSKTFVAKHLVTFLTKGDGSRCHIVQFHPSYSYEQFVEGLRPSIVNGAVQFSPEQGVVLRLAEKCRASSEDHYLIIDEFNRANLSRVLGELMYLFEYRDSEIDLPYTQHFALPKNLFFIATMNTADRSIRSIDSALRRRFDVFACPEDVEVLRRFYAADGNHSDVPDLLDGFVALNERLSQELDEHHTVGHAFFMASHFSPDDLRSVWKRKISPLIDEYFFDSPDVAQTFDLTKFWPSLL